MADIDLTTLDAVRPWVIGTDAGDADVLLARLITAASALICNYTDRPSFGLQSITERHDGSGRDYLLLRQWPAVSVGSIVFGPTIIDTPAAGRPLSDGYVLGPPPPGGGAQRLLLVGHRLPRGRSNVEVTYTAGYAVVPADVEQACIEIVGEAFKRKERIGQLSKTLGGQETIAFSQADMNAAVRAMLDPYRRVVPC